MTINAVRWTCNVREAREAAARARGTHTIAEWREVVRAAGGVCRYCGVMLCAFNGVKDHKVAIARGGSDAADNLDYICWQCNHEKFVSTPEEFAYTGPHPRPFAPRPTMRADWERFNGRRPGQ